MPPGGVFCASMSRTATKTPSPAETNKPINACSPVHYRLEIGNVNAHLFSVTLTIDHPAAQQRVSLPVWIPGSYLVREFSKNLSGLQARQGSRKLATILQLDKCSWQIECTAAKPLVLHYDIYAFDNSVRAAWLDATRGFFNGTSVCLRVEGQEKTQHLLELSPSKTLNGWQVACGLQAQKINRQGFGTYAASCYDELVDCPVEMGPFWSGYFTACGAPHRFVVAGSPPGFDGQRLLDDAQKICATQIRFWHQSVGRADGPGSQGIDKKPPFNNYLFMLNAVDDGYGGLEHRNSTALICKRQDLPRLQAAGDTKTFKPSEGYITLRGLISHEYFHTWNVKRLRPAEFENYHYERENYTDLLWFFEGFTSYYDDLLLRRAGLLDNAGYLKLLNKTINQVMQTPGRLVQSVAQASFDAWVKYYRQDENTANATVSYYTKGSLVALCFDLTLRANHAVTLDDVMRTLWANCKGGSMREADFLAALHEVAGRSFAPELASWVHGKGELPLEILLKQNGVSVLEDPAQLAHRLGVRVSETNGLHIKSVLRGGALEKAGFAAGDEWLGMEPVKPAVKVGPASGWRMSRLDDVLLYAGHAKKVIALVSRDKRLLRLELTLPPPLTTWRLMAQDAAKIDLWLDPKTT